VPNVKQLGKQILKTLIYMNRKGYTHNDVKPENIMIASNKHTVGPRRELILADPQFRLIDFAYASRDCIIAGTSTYYAPE